MLEQLRGRNLAHVGCTLGLVAGLVLGLILAFVVLLALDSDAGANWATLAFFAVTFSLGALGYYLGSRVSKRLWGADASADESAGDGGPR